MAMLRATRGARPREKEETSGLSNGARNGSVLVFVSHPNNRRVHFMNVRLLVTTGITLTTALVGLNAVVRSNEPASGRSRSGLVPGRLGSARVALRRGGKA